jgi:RNA-binding protein
MSLPAAEKRRLRSLAHHLNPVVTIAGRGLEAPVLKEIEGALSHHQLIKVKVHAEDREARQALIAALIEATGADLVQTIGHVAVIHRCNPDKPAV